ncbi:helix-turn-helix domain-containing protein [Alloyangia pacifica]|uniref:helix-turn-helix domain-containing protein n=1 Tax=Alloyangia pacifica TaxID=311180 RepID=UPI001CFC6BB9|nr:helix-turn-helix transcriptional regulator [Alloyangia pacifica]
MARDLPRNLRLLCSYHPSIAEVCRQLGVNRSQFNRYLSGETYPSLRLMQRMCDFFGVDESEMLLPHAKFSELVRLRPRHAPASVERNVVAALANDVRLDSQRALQPYRGYYLIYYNSMSHPGQVLLAVGRIYPTPFGMNLKTIENVGKPGRSKFTCKYQGACFVLGDRIFMTVMETLTKNEVMQIILYPSYNNRIRYLTGVVSGVAARAPRPPAATQIVFEYLGESIDLRRQMRRSALYAPDSPDIPEEVREMLSSWSRHPGPLVEAPLA